MAHLETKRNRLSELPIMPITPKPGNARHEPVVKANKERLPCPCRMDDAIGFSRRPTDGFLHQDCVPFLDRLAGAVNRDIVGTRDDDEVGRLIQGFAKGGPGSKAVEFGQVSKPGLLRIKSGGHTHRVAAFSQCLNGLQPFLSDESGANQSESFHWIRRRRNWSGLRAIFPSRMAAQSSRTWT